MSIQILAKAEVLETPIDAVYHKGDDKSVLLVYGHAEDPREIDLEEALGDLGQLVSLGTISSETIQKALPDSIGKAIQVSLRHAYFVKEIGNEAGEKNDKHDAQYAFWLDVHTDDLFGDLSFKVERVSLKFWSTKNQKVLEEMQINDVNRLLVEAGVIDANDPSVAASLPRASGLKKA